MIKKVTYFLIISFSITVILSCNDEDETPPCEDMDTLSQGKLETQINGNIIFDALVTSFFNRPDGSILILSDVADQFCLLRARINMSIDSTLEKQVLRSSVDNINSTPVIRFSQIDEDVVLGRWDILESENNYLQLEEISEELIKGRFNATFLIIENINDFQSLPDTLRFENVYFEAIDSESIVLR